jgi:type II secretory pathway pseudopilin PulG
MNRPDRRAGHTFIEILVVMIIIGLMVKIAYPRYHEMKRQAIAGKAAADYHAIKLASYAYHTEQQTWPAEVPSGTVPPELAPDLPNGFDFDRGDYTLDWENWQLPNGLPQFPSQSMLMALTIDTPDSLLALTILNKLGSRTLHFTSGTSTTYAILAQ